MAVVVSRGSQVHHVPHAGLPQIEPSRIASPVNTTPISAEEAARRSHRLLPVLRYAIDAMKTTKKHGEASHAVGTCRYMIRYRSPCPAGGGRSAGATHSD